jgi:hypothetical protein
VDFKKLSALKNLNVPEINPLIDYSKMSPFVSAHNAEYIGLLMAHQIRRGRLRNEAVNYLQGNDWSPPSLNGANRDVFEYYQYLKALEEADDISEELIEMIEFKKVEAETLKDRIENEQLPIEEKKELLKEWEDKIDDIIRMTTILEGLSSA